MMFSKNQSKMACGLCMILAALFVLQVFRRERMCGKEHYKLSPTGVAISEQPGCKSLFDLPNKLDCVPGPNPQSSAYTVGLTPGGICGAQKCVDAAASYKITDGIGGSLLKN
jgi:hypothetical protein